MNSRSATERILNTTNREKCENCDERDNVAVLRYIPWLEERKFVCEGCLFGDKPLFGRRDPRRPSLEEYVDLGEMEVRGEEAIQ